MPSILTGPIFAFASRLRFPTLFLITVSLFVLDLIIPDFIPLVDEILLGLGALVVASWKKQQQEPREPIDVTPQRK